MAQDTLMAREWAGESPSGALPGPGAPGVDPSASKDASAATLCSTFSGFRKEDEFY